MRGCRPLSIAESAAMFRAYAGRYRLRNQALHMLCVTTGLRVSEALSLRVADVVKKGRVVRRVKIARASTKRALAGRTIDLAAPARAAIARQVQWLLENGHLGRQQFLFLSQMGGRAITRAEAWNIFNQAARAAGLDEDQGTLGTHSWRKTYAEQVHRHFIAMLRRGALIHPMLETSRALGHKSMDSTEMYLSFNRECQQSALRHMETIHGYGMV